MNFISGVMNGFVTGILLAASDLGISVVSVVYLVLLNICQ